MYLSNQNCPDCGHILHVTWSWPAVVMGQPVKLTFVCQNCALSKALDGYDVKRPFTEDVIIMPVGWNMLERHYNIYNQTLVYMDKQYTAVNEKGEFSKDEYKSISNAV